jgi:hypothetical protein
VIFHVPRPSSTSIRPPYRSSSITVTSRSRSKSGGSARCCRASACIARKRKSGSRRPRSSGSSNALTMTARSLRAFSSRSTMGDTLEERRGEAEAPAHSGAQARAPEAVARKRYPDRCFRVIAIADDEVALPLDLQANSPHARAGTANPRVAPGSRSTFPIAIRSRRSHIARPGRAHGEPSRQRRPDEQAPVSRERSSADGAGPLADVSPNAVLRLRGDRSPAAPPQTPVPQTEARTPARSSSRSRTSVAAIRSRATEPSEQSSTGASSAEAGRRPCVPRTGLGSRGTTDIT